MKFRYILNLIMFSLLLVSCNKENFNEDDKNMLLEQNLRIASVSQDGYRSPESSRATYTKEYSTSFENGDKLGLIMIDADGNRIDNVSYTYSDGNWTNTNVFYSPKISKIIAYYPYSQDLDSNVTTVEGLKQSIQLTKDQSSVDEFEKMDLLVCEIVDVTDNLNITFSHVFSLLTFTAKTTITIGDKDYVFNLKMENVSFSISEDTYTPCNVNNAYVCLLPIGTELKNEDFRYTYNRIGEDKFIKTLKNTVTTQEGVRYNFDCPSLDGNTATTLSVGDYYCVTEENQVVIIPGSEVTLPEDLICKGILFHVMDENEWNAFETDNKLTETSLPGYAGKHGLVVSLASGEALGIKNENRTEIESAYTIAGASKELYQSKDALCGYILSNALVNSPLSSIFTALNNHKSDNIVNTTSWYCPSYQELRYLMIESGTINQQMNIVQGEQVSSSPSLTYNNIGFWLIRPDLTDYNGDLSEVIRPICAF